MRNDKRTVNSIGRVVALIVVYAIAAVLLAPGWILTIGAGFAFGLWKGFLPCQLERHSVRRGSFLVARFIARDKIESMAKRNETFRKIDNATGKEGARLIFLLRLSPVIPFNLSNYLYGLSR